MALNTTSDPLAFQAKVVQFKGIYHSATLTGNVVMDDTYPNVLKLDPGGSARDLTLPTASAALNGRIYKIVNAADAAENIVVKSGSSTVVTINQNEAAEVVCDNGAWALIHVMTIALS